MFFGSTIQETRQIFFSSWQNYLQKKPLSALEEQVVRVLLDHPEYQHVVEHQARFQEQAYYPELGATNPFLHMGLHLAVREQVATNRPVGITAAFKALVTKHQDPLGVEHLLMEQLAESLWLAQKNNQVPDEQRYLNALTLLVGECAAQS
jgi:hypothetical protein